MPIYEYRCDNCQHTLDVLQKLNDPPLKDCPECAEPALRRLVSAPAFRLKGAGWYETDFKSEKERKRNLADRAEGDKSGKKAEAGTSDAKGSTKEASKGKSESGKKESPPPTKPASGKDKGQVA